MPQNRTVNRGLKLKIKDPSTIPHRTRIDGVGGIHYVPRFLREIRGGGSFYKTKVR